MPSEENVSVPTQSPLVGLELSPEAATYVGVLEGTIAALAINECKYRALLELYTDESWEATRIDINGQALMDLAVDTLVKQTGMDRVRAKVLVTKRWNKRNQEAPTVIPQAVPVESLLAGTPESDSVATGLKSSVDVSERLQSWKNRQRAEAEAIEIPTETTETKQDQLF